MIIIEREKPKKINYTNPKMFYYKTIKLKFSSLDEDKLDAYSIKLINGINISHYIIDQAIEKIKYRTKSNADFDYKKSSEKLKNLIENSIKNHKEVVTLYVSKDMEDIIKLIYTIIKYLKSGKIKPLEIENIHRITFKSDLINTNRDIIYEISEESLLACLTQILNPEDEDILKHLDRVKKLEYTNASFLLLKLLYGSKRENQKFYLDGENYKSVKNLLNLLVTIKDKI